MVKGSCICRSQYLWIGELSLIGVGVPEKYNGTQDHLDQKLPIFKFIDRLWHKSLSALQDLVTEAKSERCSTIRYVISVNL